MCKERQGYRNRKRETDRQIDRYRQADIERERADTTLQIFWGTKQKGKMKLIGR